MLKEYAAKDTDADGVPDWQELLYGMDPEDATSVRSDIKDSEALAQGLVRPTIEAPEGTIGSDIIASMPGVTPAPGSLTEKFALTFFETYVTTGGGEKLTAEALRSFVVSAVDEIRREATRDDAYVVADFVASEGATPSSYLAGAEQAFAKNALSLPESELTYFSDAVLKSDTNALAQVKRIGDHYVAIAEGLRGVAAPIALTSAHQSLTNAIARLGATIGDMASLTDDPVRAMIGFGNYEKDARSMIDGFKAVKKAYDATGAARTGAGAGFYALLSATSL